MAPESFRIYQRGYFERRHPFKRNNPPPSPLPPEIELALTIRFLASGNSYQDLSMCFCVHKSTIAKFIPEACQSNYARLKDTYLKVRNFHY